MVWTFTWQANGQAAIPLNNTPHRTVIWQSLVGAMSPPFEPVTEEVPLTPGTHLKYIDVEENEIDLILYINGDTEPDLWDNINSISYLFNPLLGEGTFTVQTPSTTSERSIDCYCISGLEMDEADLMPHCAQFNLTFFAPYPYWRGPIQSQKFNLIDNQAEWFPILPLTLGADALTAEFEITNNGDVPSPPVWTIGGPGRNPIITNLDTGERIAFTNGDTVLFLGDILTIDTKEKTVIRNSSENLISRLSFDSVFWDLERGVNNVQIQMIDATTDSYIQADYYNWYLGVV